jgi:hypothetical protein
MQFRNMARRLVLAAVVTTTMVVGPHAADVALGQGVPQAICGGQTIEPPKVIGQPDANGWASKDENLQAGDAVRRYRFTVKEKGTAYVYVGDQWYDLNLGLFSLKTGQDVGCWTVQTKATSDTNEMHRLGFVRPDERAVEVEPGDYVLSARVADNAMVDPSRNFTVRVAVGPRVCSLVPANIPDPEYPGMTNKPDNPDLFQLGVTFQPDASELGPFTLMSFNAFMSPPFNDLFEFTWELDGQVVAGETGATILKPYAELPKTPLGLHTVKMTAKAVREYQDPTEARFNVMPFDGGSRSVTCQFRGQS